LADYRVNQDLAETAELLLYYPSEFMLAL